MAHRKRNPDAGVMVSSGQTDVFSIWKARLYRAERLWTEYRRIIQKFYDAYEGIFEWESRNPSYIAIPLAFAHAKFRIPNLYLKDPFIRVRARVPFCIESPGDRKAGYGASSSIYEMAKNGEPVQIRDNVLGAEIIQNALSHEMHEMNFKWHAKLSILDALFCYGVVKLGYHTEFTFAPGKSEIEMMKAESNSGEDRETLEWNQSIKRESIWAIRVDPWDFRYDPDIKMLDPELSQARWVAFRNIRPLADVKADPLYKNTSDLAGTAFPDDPSYVVGGHPSQAFSMDDPYVVLWEIWDKKAKKIYVIAEGHEGFLRENDWPFEMEGFPMAFLHFNDPPSVRRSKYEKGDPTFRRAPGPFPISDFGEWYEINHVINVAESMNIESLKRRQDKWVYTEGALSPEDLEKLKQPLTSAFVGIKDVNAIKELKSSPGGQAEGNIVNRMTQWLYQVEGVSAQQRGASEADKTATEVTVVQNNLEARQAEAQDRVKDWIKVLAQKMIALMKQFFTKERVVPIVGREDFQWIPYTSENIKGDYDLDIDLSPFDPTKPEVAVKQLTDTLALLSRFPQIPDGHGGLVNVNLSAVVRELLANMPIKLRPQEILVPAMGGGPPTPGGVPGQAPSPEGPAGTPPLPGEGGGADQRSLFASQGAGASMVQALREGGQPQPMAAGLAAGAGTSSRGR